MKKELIELLKGGSAHASLASVFKGILPENRNLVPDRSTAKHTIWEELEHMRLAQEDIIRYMLDEGWISPEWPEGYWPEKGSYCGQKWENSLNGFLGDLEYLIKFIDNSDIDFTDPIPHADQHSYLREILLVADHNAYHGAKVVELRKQLGDW